MSATRVDRVREHFEDRVHDHCTVKDDVLDLCDEIGDLKEALHFYQEATRISTERVDLLERELNAAMAVVSDIARWR